MSFSFNIVELNDKKHRMRRFHSYGPVDCEEHFCVERRELIDQCTAQLIGKPEKGGHYFTIWAPRQTGKTWLMRQVIKKIQTEYSDQFLVGSLSMQGVIIEDDKPDDIFLTKIPLLFYEGFRFEDVAVPENWEDFKWLFAKNTADRLFDRPLILFIDEFDSLPRHVIDRIVTLFRDMYLKRESYLLHGLTLIGVRAVLGVESQRGSPFNIQRALHVPKFTPEKVKDLYRQYQEESGQTIAPAVVEHVYHATRGQPGLVSWFGELLTERYNPGHDHIIDLETWNLVWHKARFKEPNNTVMNLIAKARIPEYQDFLLQLFTREDMLFSFHDPLVFLQVLIDG